MAGEREVNEEIFNLIGDAQVILDKARELLTQGQAQLGLQVLDALIQARPGNVEARKLRIEILEELSCQDHCVMSRNAWVYFINQDEEFLRSKKSKNTPAQRGSIADKENTTAGSLIFFEVSQIDTIYSGYAQKHYYI